MRNRIKTATPAVQTYIEDKTDEVSLPEEHKQQATEEPNVSEGIDTQDDTGTQEDVGTQDSADIDLDDSWLAVSYTHLTLPTIA